MATEVELFNAAVVSALPHGMIVAHAGKTVPDGFLLCNGAAVSRKTYAKLFEAIGELWGAGDGSTTFNLPDSDGRVLQGATDVSKVGKYLEAGLPNIIGEFSSCDNGDREYPTGAFYDVWDYGGTIAAGYGCEDLRFGMKASNSNAIYSNSTVQPPACQILIIIKV